MLVTPLRSAALITTPGYGGDAEVLFKSVGNGIGVELEPEYAADKLPAYGSLSSLTRASLDDADGITIARLGSRPPNTCSLGVWREDRPRLAAGRSVRLRKVPARSHAQGGFRRKCRRR